MAKLSKRTVAKAREILELIEEELENVTTTFEEIQDSIEQAEECTENPKEYDKDEKEEIQEEFEENFVALFNAIDEFINVYNANDIYEKANKLAEEKFEYADGF